jgi:hypothetical protein
MTQSGQLNAPLTQRNLSELKPSLSAINRKAPSGNVVRDYFNNSTDTKAVQPV